MFLLAEGKELVFPKTFLKDLIVEVNSHSALLKVRVKGSSMAPFLKDSDVVTLLPFPCPIRYGDIVALLLRQDNFVIHRVVAIGKNSFGIKGDNTAQADGSVAKSDILAKVISIERRGLVRNFGLGRERMPIAFLSRRGWLAYLYQRRQIIPTFLRRRML